LVFNEDKKFFWHHGFDLEEVSNSVGEWARGRRRLRGASTLTQQLARTIFLSTDRTVTRKVLEAIDTVELERHFTKDEILLLYVNNVEWGPGVYGVGAAAAHYFSKKPAALEPLECVFLVAILPSTRRLGADFRKRPLKHATTVRMRHLLDGLRDASTRAGEDGSASNDLGARLIAAVREARARARRAAR
jgi:membrane peptidoglycan carboxypeptidase